VTDDVTISHLEVAVEGRKVVYTAHFTAYKAVARSRRQSCDKKWRSVTSGDRSDLEVTSFDRKSPGIGAEVRKLAYTVHFTSYKAVACRRRQPRDRKWRQVTGRDPEVTSFDRKSPGSGCRRQKTCVYCTFHFLQRCSSQKEAVTWPEITSHDHRWPEVTRKSLIWAEVTWKWL